MGRPRTIHIDPHDLLRGVAAAMAADVAALEGEIEAIRAAVKAGEADRFWSVQNIHQIDQTKQALLRWGVAYDLERFTGRSLTASERIRAQQAMRRLHDEGLVDLPGRRATTVAITPAGVEALRQYADACNESNNPASESNHE